MSIGSEVHKIWISLRKNRNFRRPKVRKSGLNGLPPFEQARKTALFLFDRTFPGEVGYAPIEEREANLFFNMISELYEKVSVIVRTTQRGSNDPWTRSFGPHP
jgi:hypothetical protein